MAGIVVKDLGTRWFDVYAVATNDAADAGISLKEFASADAKVKSFYSDGSKELIKAAKHLEWLHDEATPGRPQSNGDAERTVRAALDGTRTNLEKAGLKARWWPHAGKYFCFACNIREHNGDSSYNRRHLKGSFNGPQHPFGCLIDFKPAPTRDLKDAKFEPKSIPGLFLGYHLHSGGRWKGEFLVCPLSDFAKGGRAEDANERYTPQRVREVYRDLKEPIVFSLKAAYDRERRELPAIEDAGGGENADEILAIAPPADEAEELPKAGGRPPSTGTSHRRQVR